VIERVHNEDPVCGFWNAPSGGRCQIWCDASQIASGCVVQIDGVTVEDGSWLRPINDEKHINVAELEAVMKGINMAMKWKPKEIIICTDSRVVFGWLKILLNRDKKIAIMGLSEMLIRRRLSLIDSVLKEYNLTWQCKWVSSDNNLADKMTRVKQSWLRIEKVCFLDGEMRYINMDQVRFNHEKHHGGIKRTMHLIERSGLHARERDVRDVVRN